MSYPSDDLHRSLRAFGRTEKIRLARAPRAAVAEGKSAGTAQIVGVFAQLAMRGRDDEAILVIRDRHDLVHFLDGETCEADACGDLLVDHAVDGLRAHIGAHRK